MRKLVMLLTPLLVLVLVLTAVGCGGDDEETPTPTPVPTEAGETPTPGAETPAPDYTGESVEFKVTHGASLGTIGADRWEYIDERLQYHTDGECKLEIYPAGSLYRGLEEWDACSTGAVDMMTIGHWQPQMQGMMDWQMGFLGFYWGETKDKSVEHWERFAEHPDGGGKLLAELEDQNIKGVGFYSSSALTMNLNKKRRVPSLLDMPGWKLWSVGGYSDLLVKVCGCKPVFLDPAENQIAFEQGLVDSLNTSPDTVLNTKMYETAKYGLMSSPVAGAGCISMNLDLWNSLSPELQDVWLNKILPDARQWSVENDLPFYLQCLEELETEHGMTIDWISPEERLYLREQMWELGWEWGYLEMIDQEMLKLADHLRSEPYDTGHFFP